MNAMQARALAAEVLAGIAPEADLATVREDEDLRAALDLDSMDFMNFVIGLSERSGRAISEADTPRLHTLRGLFAYLAAR
ncbi:acyl carrier protein [Variovorax sp. YR216]|uniref:acyl carrier protein n=1 Tax=Variovorax sp. YR216 TaxID=1882828 RepID=UPI00089A6129|nr:acyl carrier protein [Variovorax sp. YR216]SEB20536.1 Acyl carrier protein [Variovorax sp. YR216]